MVELSEYMNNEERYDIVMPLGHSTLQNTVHMHKYIHEQKKIGIKNHLICQRRIQKKNNNMPL